MWGMRKYPRFSKLFSYLQVLYGPTEQFATTGVCWGGDDDSINHFEKWGTINHCEKWLENRVLCHWLIGGRCYRSWRVRLKWEYLCGGCCIIYCLLVIIFSNRSAWWRQRTTSKAPKTNHHNFYICVVTKSEIVKIFKRV